MALSIEIVSVLMAYPGKTVADCSSTVSGPQGASVRMEAQCEPGSAWQRERDHLIAALRVGFCMSARGNDDILAPLPYIGHRRCLSARGQAAAPQFLAGLGVERAQVIVERRPDEDNPARRRDRPAKIRRARLLAQDIFRERRQIFR